MNRNRIARWALVALPLALAACATRPPAPQPVKPPPSPPAPAPAPAKVTDWRDVDLTPGSWSYQQDGRSSEARFGPADAAPMFIMRCDRAARTVALLRPGVATGQLTIRTSYGVRNWPLTPAGAILPGSDSALDQIAFSRGRFSVDASGQPTLFLPSWAEPSRVIEDCRG